MHIDLTRRPLVIQPNVCEGHIVVRTLATRTVTGYVTHRHSSSSEGTKTYQRTLEPSARLQRGSNTMLETRLEPLVPLTHVRVERRFEGTAQASPPVHQTLQEPYEVASGYFDLLTNRYGEWRLQVNMQPRSNGVWLVMVSKSDEPPLTAVSVKDLIVQRGLNLGGGCDFPLARHIQATTTAIEQPETVWDRLTLEE